MAVTLLCVLCHTFAVWGEEKTSDSEQPSHKIILVANGDSFSFGQDVSFQVRFQNTGKTPWKMPKPQESLSVKVQFRVPESTRRPYGYSLGRMTHTTVEVNGETWTAMVAPAPEQTSIAPGETYEFSTDMERDWSGWLVPGHWDVWVEDHTDDPSILASNLVKIPLRFTEDSIAACLAIARDKEVHVYQRKWHGEWLKKIMPALQLKWWAESVSAEEQKRGDEEIQKNLKAFEKFVKDKNNAEAITKAIQAINHDAGLDAEEANTTSQPATTTAPAAPPPGR